MSSPCHGSRQGRDGLDVGEISIRALKAIHNATHPAARLRKKDAPEDITAAILCVRPEDADSVHPLPADMLEEDAEA